MVTECCAQVALIRKADSEWALNLIKEGEEALDPGEWERIQAMLGEAQASIHERGLQCGSPIGIFQA